MSDGRAGLRRWWPPALWTLTVAVVTSWPNPGLPTVSHLDKLVHLTLYGVLGFLVGRVDRSFTAVPARALAAIAACAALAAVDEWHQRFIPGRSSSAGDWTADAVGAILGLTVAAVVARRAVRATAA